MSRNAEPAVRQAPLGCLIALAIPLLLFGISMLGSATDAVRAGDVVRIYWYGVGTLIGLGIPAMLLLGRRMNPQAPVSEHTPFGCYATIGGGFLIFGTGMLLSTVREYLGGDGESAMMYGFGALIGLVPGIWFIVGGRLESGRDAPLVDALRRDDPEPWRYVAQWSDGEARYSGRAAAWGDVIFATFWNVVSWPVVWAVSFEATGHPSRFIFWAFPLFGVWLAFRAVRSIRQQMIFGETVFRMDTFPGVVGQALEGAVLTRIDPERGRGAGFTATLTCVRRRERVGSSSSSGNRVQTERLWQHRQELRPRAYQTAEGRRIGFPISFSIPDSARPTTLRAPSDRILWELEITGSVGRLPFRAAMEVPVFDLREESVRALEVPDLSASPDEATGSGPPEPASWEQAGSGGRADAPAARPTLWRRVFPSPACRFVIDEHHGGRIDVVSETGDAARARAGMFLAIAGVLGLLVVMRSPALQAIDGIGLVPVWAIFGGCFLWLFYYRYTRAELTITDFDVTMRGRGVKDGQVMLRYDQLERATVHEGAERTTTQNGIVVHRVTEHDIRIAARNGRTYRAGLRVTDPRRAQWVAGTINQRIAARSPSGGLPS